MSTREVIWAAKPITSSELSVKLTHPCRTHRSTCLDPPHAHTSTYQLTNVLVQAHYDCRDTLHTHIHAYMAHSPSGSPTSHGRTQPPQKETRRTVFFLHLTLPPVYVPLGQNLKCLPPLYCFPLSLCIVHLRRLSYLSLLVSGTLHSVGYIFPSLLCLTLLFSSAVCKVSSGNHFAFSHFFFLAMVLVTAFCTTLRASIHTSSGTLSTRSNPFNLSHPLYNHKGFDLGHIWMV